MVMCSVQELGRVRPVCFARTLLYSAQDAIDRGEAHSAGIMLLRATRYYLEAMCIAHDVKPAKSLLRVIRQLRKAHGINEGIDDWLQEITKVGLKCVRCERVQPVSVENCIAFLHFILNNSPEVEFPTREGGAV